MTNLLVAIDSHRLAFAMLVLAWLLVVRQAYRIGMGIAAWRRYGARRNDAQGSTPQAWVAHGPAVRH